MSDEEVLPLGNDLSKYMISEGFIDFDTYKQDTLHSKFNSDGSYRYTNAESSSLLKNNLDCTTTEPSLISSHDRVKLMNLLNSKLLLPEDFELTEFLISRTITSKSQTNYWWLYSGSVIASTISVALYFRKRVSFLLPGGLISALSFMCMRHCYHYFHSIHENKSFSSAIISLQKLCLDVHKLFRLLKETEILSTGQVTSHNVGAAFYIPLKNIQELETIPSWKTLPHLRKFLANSLLDMIDLLESTCVEARQVVPNWLYIEGYTFSNESLLINPHTRDHLRMTEDYISLKDLQLLNDSYLILQSELLRWIGFCICPSMWITSDSNYKSSRTQILNLFFSTHLKLSAISFKLKMHYDIQNIYSEGEQLINQKRMGNGLMDINNVQLELHSLFSLILSMLIHLKNLEDQLENDCPDNSKTSVINVRTTMGQELKKVRDELTYAVNMFDAVVLRCFPDKKSSPTQSDKLEKESFNDCIFKPQIYPFKENTSQSDCHTNSLDEVFLAVTDFSPNEQETQRDDWDIESKPPIPKTLMAELSTTLKPIKENFKEREKVALERAGLEDINNESDSENEVTDKHLHRPRNSAARQNMKKKRKKIRIRTDESPCCMNEDAGSDSSICSMEDTVLDKHTKLVSFQNTPIVKEVPNSPTCFTVLNDKSIANMIAMKSQSWGLAEEEHFSDD